MQYRVRALSIGALAISLAAGGCSKVGNGEGNKAPDDGAKKAIIMDTKGTAVVPAAAVSGAKPGGQIIILDESDFEHLDPQQIYISNALATSTQLFHRMLTTYKESADKNKPLELVGDLATNSGTTTDGGKTWKYTLRDGIKFEDGTPITAKDINYGIARSFGAQGVQGPQYLQDALDSKRAYKGPADGNLNVPGVKVLDDKTIEFSFEVAHPELPYLLSYPTSTPVPQGKDTKDKYDTEWISSGPYKRKEHKKDEFLLLERNPNWDPKTDPVRHQYPDTIKYEFTSSRDTQTARLKSGTGEDATAIMSANVAQTDIPTVQGDAEMMKRIIDGPSAFAGYIYINTLRVKDVDVRRALNYAYDKDSALKVAGGSAVAQPSTTILAPVVPGFKNYNAYPAGPSGDVEKAKQLLQGKNIDKLQYCYGNRPAAQKSAAALKTGLERAGFSISLNPLDPKSYYGTVGKKDTTCDLISGGWGQDFPDGDSTLGVLMDGAKILEKGNQNLSYFNDEAINKELHALRAVPDRDSVAAKYGELDEKIMKEHAPVITTFYTRVFSLIGPKVGGAFLSPLWAHVNLVNIYVK